MISTLFLGVLWIALVVSCLLSAYRGHDDGAL